jgi:hypothetical protein
MSRYCPIDVALFFSFLCENGIEPPSRLTPQDAALADADATPDSDVLLARFTTRLSV